MAAVPFPTHSAPQGAQSWIGRQMPTFVVERWYTAQPDPTGRVLVMDFWATWCPPCRAAIPHMNELQRNFSRDVCCVGITNETSSNFEEGCKKHNLDPSDFGYSLAGDTKNRLGQTFGVRGIPSVFVASSDGVIRWQGHPSSLSADVLGGIVQANRAMVGGSGGGAASPKRWNKSKG